MRISISPSLIDIPTLLHSKTYQYFIEQSELFVNHFTIKTKVLQYTIDEKL